MPLRTNPVAFTLRLLFGVPRQDTLRAGGRGMGRRFVLFAIAAAILGGLGYAAYSYFDTPDVEQVQAPKPPDVSGELPSAERFEELAKTDPVLMFEACLARYKREGWQGVSAHLEKQERVKGTMNDRETIRLMCSGDVPDESGNTPNLRVRMIWESGHRKVLGVKTLATLYAPGGSDNRMQTLTSLGNAMAIDPKGAMPRGASRYCIADAGLYRGMLRTYDAWKRRQAAGELNASFLGVQSPKELGGRPCYVVRRRCPNPEVDSFALDESADPKADPQRDGAAEVTAFIDIEQWLHVGTILKRADGSPLAEYWFRDVKPSKSAFAPDPFTLDAIKADLKK